MEAVWGKVEGEERWRVEGWRFEVGGTKKRLRRVGKCWRWEAGGGMGKG